MKQLLTLALFTLMMNSLAAAADEKPKGGGTVGSDSNLEFCASDSNQKIILSVDGDTLTLQEVEIGKPVNVASDNQKHIILNKGHATHRELKDFNKYIQEMAKETGKSLFTARSIRSYTIATPKSEVKEMVIFVYDSKENSTDKWIEIVGAIGVLASTKECSQKK